MRIGSILFLVLLALIAWLVVTESRPTRVADDAIDTTQPVVAIVTSTGVGRGGGYASFRRFDKTGSVWVKGDSFACNVGRRVPVYEGKGRLWPTPQTCQKGYEPSKVIL